MKDTVVNEFNGTFTDWRITLWGECIDAASQEPLPMPEENDDDDHDIISDSPTKVSITAGQPQPTGLPANPSDHQDRPVNAKPSKSTEKPAAQTAAVSATSSAPESNTTLPDTPAEEDTSQENILPHYFPTFGVSKRTQIWIYGALAIIVLFCAGLCAYFFIQRRKRRRNEREDYEFEELLDGEDANGAAGGKRSKRRAGELYDAFAGGSEEEDEGLLTDDDDDEGEGREGYRDVPAATEDRRGRSQSREGDEKS